MSKARAKCQGFQHSRPERKLAAQIPEGMHQLRLHEKIPDDNLFRRCQSASLGGLKTSWRVGMAYPQRPPSRADFSASEQRHERRSKRRFRLKRPNRSMKALGHLHPRSHLRPWRQNPCWKL